MRIQKEKLLQTKLFIDNDKLDKYVNLINVGDNIADYTEKHHIIPKSYFRIIGQRIDNSRGNIIKLSYFNHILAHYYLSLCTIGRLRQANIIAFTLLINTGVEILTKSEVEAVKQLKEAAILHEEAKKICRDKCSELGNMKKTAEHKKALKEARDLHSTTKGKKSIYNPLSNKVKFVYSTEIDDYLKAGWALGGKPLSEATKQKIGKSNSVALKGKRHQAKKENKLNSGLAFNKVECIETGQIFNNIIEAKKWLQDTAGIDGGQIRNCCAGKRETTGGYHWRYYKVSEEIVNEQRIKK